MIIIGEKINSSITEVNAAIINEDSDFIQNLAKLQEEAGADYIDVNAGTLLDQESSKIIWLINTVREITSKPLVIDSPNPEVIKIALEVYTGPTPIINSISLEEDRYNSIIGLVKEYKTKVIALCMDDTGVPDSTDSRMSIARKLITKLNSEGIKNDDILLDPLVKPLATGTEDSKSTLESIGLLRELFPDLHIVCGLSNISFGLPGRKLINRAFLASAMTQGLDSAILDPLDTDLMGVYYATNALLGNDEYCMEYITQYRENKFK